MILIVDDDKNHRLMLKLHIKEEGYECIEAQNGVEAIQLLENHHIKIILLDITMDIMDGLTFLSYIRDNGNNTPVIIITADSEAKTAVSAMKLGAADYLTKPVDTVNLIEIIKDLLGSQNTNASEKTVEPYIFKGVYDKNGFGKIINLLKLVAPTDATVLILGESGTGKELAARSVHDNSPRRNKPFVAVNLAALNENLIESELFGHVKGAFTGASSHRTGRIAEADGGTLFIDEAGEMPSSVQVKLLRFLQEKTYEQVGSSKTIHSDVRLIAATNKDLKELSLSGGFRQDLYFRLAIFPVTMTPLRERKTELPMLIDYFVNIYAKRFQKSIRRISPDFYKALQAYSFPGNVRELENLVERSIILAVNDELNAGLLPDFSPQQKSLKENEKQNIIDILSECDNNKTKAAAMLGISRRGLYNKIKEYGIQ